MASSPRRRRFRPAAPFATLPSRVRRHTRSPTAASLRMIQAPLLLAALFELVVPQQPAAPAPAATGATQAPKATAPPADLQQLAQRVDDAHRPRGPVPPVTAFRTSIELQLLDARAEDRGEVALRVQFLEWTRANSNKVRPLIRCEVQQAGAPIVRGRDRDGPWHLFQGEAKTLGADFAEDLKACDRDTNLARQLIRFLSPGAVLRSLQQPLPLRDEALTIERGLAIECVVAEGDLASFPLLQQAGDDVPVRARVYVTKDRHRLLAVDVWPILAGVPDPARTERILLLDLHERDGLLVPRELKHLFREASGQLRLKSRALLRQLELRPELRAEDFDRKV